MCNIYAPNTLEEQKKFYKSLSDLVRDHTCCTDLIIIGGDYNIVLDPFLDKKARIMNPAQSKKPEK